MALFVCWSGEAIGKPFAHAACAFLGEVLPDIDAFLSSDLDKGGLWFDDLSANLKRSRAGLVCLTPDNLRSPWMHFEAGALFGGQKKRRIFAYALDADVVPLLEGPLAHFQASVATQEETLKMVEDISTYFGVADQSWRARFDEKWPAMAATVSRLHRPSIRRLLPRFGDYLNSKTFYEPMPDCMDQAWRDRFSRVKAVLSELNGVRPAVEKTLPKEQVAQFQQLASRMDEYLRLLGQLVTSRQFTVEHAKVDFARPTDGAPALAHVGPWSAQILQDIRTLTEQLAAAGEPGAQPVS